MTQINPNYNDIRLINNPALQTGQSLQAQTQPQVQNNMPEVQIPDLYYTPVDDNDIPKTPKEQLKKADMMNIVYPWFEHPILMAGTSAGLIYGVNQFSKACSGDYATSLVGKTAQFGDKIQNSNLIQSKPAQTIIGLGTKGGKKIKDLAMKSQVLRAIFTTPSRPEWDMPLGELFNTKQRLVQEFSQITNALKLIPDPTRPDDFVPLKSLGVSKKDSDFVKTLFNGMEYSPAMESNAIQLRRIKSSIEKRIAAGEVLEKLTDKEILDIVKSPNATEQVREKLLKLMDIDTKWLQEIHGAKDITEEMIEKTIEACKKAPSVRCGEGNYKLLGKFQIFERYLGFDELFNRFHSIGEGAKTATGRFMAKLLQKLHRGFTFGGGKLGVLAFVAPHLVETMMNVKKADPDQKVGTLVNGAVMATSWVFTFPLAIKIMHAFGGMQYAGMTPEQVAEYRKILNEFNQKVLNGEFADKAAYDKALKGKFGVANRLKSLKRVKNQTLFTKLCRKIGGFMTGDLERIKAFRGDNIVSSSVRRLPSFLRNLGGVPLRFALWGIISVGVLDAFITKGIKSIFGNYYDHFKEEEHETNKKAQKKFTKTDLQSRLLEIQREKVANQMGLNQTVQPEVPQTTPLETTNNQINNTNKVTEFAQGNKIDTVAQPTETPLETKTSEEATETIEQKGTASSNAIPQNNTNNTLNNDNYTYIPQPNSTIEPSKVEKRDNYTYIPSEKNVIKNEKEEFNSNRYVPAQTAGNFTKTFDNSGLSEALKRADRAEKNAIDVLSGKFNNI